MAFVEVSKSFILDKIFEMASAGGRRPEPYRIYYYENHGKSYRGADLEHANIVACNFAEAFMLARNYILTYAAPINGYQVDLFDLAGIVSRDAETDEEAEEMGDHIIAGLFSYYSSDSDTLWIQRACEPCQMEWSDSEEEPVAGAKRARYA